MSLLPTFLHAEENVAKLLSGARSQIGVTTRYDGSYVSIPYPNGDVPITQGVCTDVLIRAYRTIGYDLQKLLHEDIKQHYSVYPSKRIWGLSRPDRNIDHRRVPNLEVFFRRHGEELSSGSPLRPGDIVSWTLPGNLPHIGIVSDQRSKTSHHLLIIHNIGEGTKEDDVVGKFPRRHHFRFHPWQK